MRILFVMRHSGFVRNFESALVELASRGHHVHLAFELPREQADLAERLAAADPTLTFGTAPVRSDAWTGLAYDLRSGVDALRYMGSAYAEAPKLRERGLRTAPAALTAVTRPRFMRGPRALDALGALHRHALSALPTDPGLDAFIAERAPDVVLVTPLVAGPVQDDVVRSARAAGIPTALAVTSWDNLTNKGLIRETVDRVYVWNEAQRREAVEHHGVPPERVGVTGAHTYDHWFAWEPSTDRAAFCAKVGLPEDRPIVLYLCSSKFIAPTEPAFVARWLKALRAGPAPLRDASVLIRPHPATGAWWADVDLDDDGPTAVWPRVGADPRTSAAKSDYYDSMFHARAAVGINTSALIELAIVGRPAFTILDPEFADTQAGTLHFAHLTQTEGGILTTAASFEEHHAQLVAALEMPAVDREAFLRAFVRPYGRDVRSAARLADEVETLTVVAPVRARSRADDILVASLVPLRRLAGAGKRRTKKRGRVERWVRKTRLRKRARRWKRFALRPWTIVRRG
jgi:hypothetical protein